MGDEKETLWGRVRMVCDEVNERADELRSETDPEDTLHEIADTSVPIYTADLLAIAADSIDMATLEPEMGPAFDGMPTPVNIIAANIYEALYAAAIDEWELVKDKVTTDDQ